MKSNKKDITELLAVNRRNFIKLAVGGAVGTGLTPLPWKLIDDSAIFTQNFPWVPVPETGKFTKVKTHCSLCPGGCGIEVRKVGDRAVKIEGRTDHPVNPGGICPLGMGGLQLLYNENIRFTGPMKRVGTRGSGKFEPISWDEALKILSHRILELRNKGKANSIVAVDGNRSTSTMSLMIERFLKSIGSPNYMKMPSAEDTSEIVSNLMYGTNNSITYDLENSDYILSFGCGLLEGWGSPGRVLNAWGMWKSHDTKGDVTIVQVESRASNTASKADKWIAAKPGSETALALGIANVIIREGLYNKEFVDNNTFGFLAYQTKDGKTHKGFKDLILEEYTLEKVSRVTGIAPDEITAVAKAYAKAKAPVAICGKGKGLLNGDVLEFMAVHTLNALTGSINKPGGVYISDPLPLSPLPEIKIDELAAESLKKPRFDKAGDISKSHSIFNTLTDTILSEKEPVVDTILVFASNPAFTLPDGGDFYQALTKTPFVVSFSPYLDETALMADLILPDHTYLEKTEDILSPSTIQYHFYGMTQPVITPLYNTRNSGDVLLGLAGIIGGSIEESFPWKKYEDIIKVRVKGLFESREGSVSYDPSVPAWKLAADNNKTTSDHTDFEGMWKELKTGGMWFNPYSNTKATKDLFNTESGKFEFASNRLESVKALPEKHEGAYPLQMLPYEIINLSSGWLPNPPYLNKTLFDDQLLKDDSFAEINPKTAGKYHLKEGDNILITSEKGKLEAKVHLFEGAMPGVVYMPMGFGHTAYDDYVRGKGCSPNSIMTGHSDPVSGQPTWWNTPVRIKKVHI